MTNEALVAEIQAGAMDRMGELWEQVEALVKVKARQFMNALTGHYGVDVEDLIQSGYLAMVAAVDTYKPAAGRAFSSWLAYYLKTAFSETVGCRTQKGYRDPLNNYISLNTPLTDAVDSDELSAVVADPAGQQWQESLEESIWRKQLQGAMATAMSAVPEPYRDVLYLRYWDNMTLKAVGELRGVGKERIRQMENKGLRILRRPEIVYRLYPFWEFDFFRGTGLGAFRLSGASIQERYLLIQEERKEREAARRQKIRENEMRGAVDVMIERVNREAETRVANMSSEEKEWLMQMYGLT